MYRENVAGRFPQLGATCVKAVACLTTATSDFGFVIDRHPEYPQILIASPCSGHGFKHSAAVGEVTAELINQGETRFDTSKFTLDRFSRSKYPSLTPSRPDNKGKTHEQTPHKAVHNPEHRPQ